MARKKVEILLKSEDGSFELKEFDQSGPGEEEKGQGEPKKKKAKAGEALL